MSNSSLKWKESIAHPKQEWQDYCPGVHFKYGAVKHVDKFEISNKNKAQKNTLYYIICLTLFS